MESEYFTRKLRAARPLLTQTLHWQDCEEKALHCLSKLFSQPRQCSFYGPCRYCSWTQENEEHGVATNYRQSFPSKFQRTPSNVSTARWASTLLKYLYLDQHSSSTILHPNYIYHLPTPVYVEAIWIMVLTNHFILHSYDLVEAGSTFLLSPLALSPFTHVLGAARSDNRNRPAQPTFWLITDFTRTTDFSAEYGYMCI